MCSCHLRPRRDGARCTWARRTPIGVPLLLWSLSGCGTNFELSGPNAVPTRVMVPNADAQVPVTVLNNLIFLDATVNGAGPYRFLLDTGASLGQISPAISAQFPENLLNRTTTIAGPLGETQPSPLFRVDSLNIGGVDFQDFAVVVRDVPGMFSGVPFTVDGIAGIGLFRNVVLSLDYPGQQIRVQTGVLPAVDDCTILPIIGGDLGPGGTYILPAVDITLQGQTVSAYLDSGNSGMLLLPDSFANLPFDNPPAQVTTFTQNGQTILLEGIFSGTVGLGCVQFGHPSILVGGTLASLGAAGLQSFVVSIDQVSKSARFLRP